jgi:hypothetical protein
VPAAQVADGIESTQSTPGRMTCGPHQVLNLNDFSNAQLQNSKRCSSWPLKFMKDSEIAEKINGINVSFFCQTSISKRILNYKFRKEPKFEFGLNSKGLQTFWKKS